MTTQLSVSLAVMSLAVVAVATVSTGAALDSQAPTTTVPPSLIISRPGGPSGPSGPSGGTVTSLPANLTEEQRKERCAHLKTIVSALGQERERSAIKKIEMAQYERMQRSIDCPSDDALAGTWELTGKNDRFTRGLSATLTVQRMDGAEGVEQAKSLDPYFGQDNRGQRLYADKCVVQFHERFYSGTIDWRGPQPRRDTVLICADPPGPGSTLLLGTGRFKQNDDQSGSLTFLMPDVDKMDVIVKPERSGQPTYLNFDAKRTQK